MRLGASSYCVCAPTYGGAPCGRSAAGSQVRQPCTAVGAAMGRTGMTMVLRKPPMVLRKPPIVLRRPPIVLRKPPIIMGRNRRNRRTKRTFHTNPVGLKVRRCFLSSPLFSQGTPWVAHNGKSSRDFTMEATAAFAITGTGVREGGDTSCRCSGRSCRWRHPSGWDCRRVLHPRRDGQFSMPSTSCRSRARDQTC